MARRPVRLTPVLTVAALLAVALGAVIAVAPGRVPGLTEPGMTRGMPMEQVSPHVS